MHGEYKIPNGKMVVADVETDGNTIIKAQIAGDFFLEPAEALADINAAVIGLPITASVEDIASLISAKVPAGTQFIGFSAQSVAIAVRRALGVSKTWRDFEWQIIDAEPMTPAMHVAVDDVLAREVAEGRRAPTLRFWDWERPAIIIGAFQSLKNEVDLEAAEGHGVTTVRRMTGGGAMFVEPGSTITYSVYAPGELVADMTIADSYSFLDNWVLVALNEMGVEATYKPLNDISSPAGKIGGAAQKRYMKGTVLHHVTMAYDMDAAKMMQVLRIGREKLSDKGTASAAKRVDPVRSQTNLERDIVMTRMRDTFVKLHGGTPASLTDDERAQAEKLVEEKFGTEKWLNFLP
ncbi:MAG: biotin/lipoate A/B protein ligase family protein [Pseudomonadota bacterium]